MLDRMCMRYGQRPSNIIGIKDDIQSMDFDIAVMFRAQILENENQDNKPGSPKIPKHETKEQFEQRKAGIKTQFDFVNIVKGK